MASITMSADVMTLQEDILDKVVEAFIRQEMTRAVKEFLRACVMRIPQRTGFLRGSFYDILRFFKVSGTGAGQSGYATKTEYYYPSRGTRIEKRPLYGTRFATPPDQVIQRSGSKAVFNLDIDITYYSPNDFSARIPGAPWNSIKEGLSAMTNYLEGSPNRFPKIEALLTRMTIRARGTSVSTNVQTPNVSGIIATRELLIEGF